MTAKKKTIIAVTLGAVLGIAMAIFMYINMSTAGEINNSEDYLGIVVIIPVFMLYAFGYTFGWRRCKGFVAGATKLSADVAFIYLIVHIITGKGLTKGLFIAMFILMAAISVVWLPGVIWGIQALITEKRAGAV